MSSISISSREHEVQGNLWTKFTSKTSIDSSENIVLQYFCNIRKLIYMSARSHALPQISESLIIMEVLVTFFPVDFCSQNFEFYFSKIFFEKILKFCFGNLLVNFFLIVSHFLMSRFSSQFSSNFTNPMGNETPMPTGLRLCKYYCL